jgi:hypothetical protein
LSYSSLNAGRTLYKLFSRFSARSRSYYFFRIFASKFFSSFSRLANMLSIFYCCPEELDTMSLIHLRIYSYSLLESIREMLSRNDNAFSRSVFRLSSFSSRSKRVDPLSVISDARERASFAFYTLLDAPKSRFPSSSSTLEEFMAL